jgi:indole-3-glycerol phosphate synthase
MHPLIDEILQSTKMRIHPLTGINKNKITARNFKYSLKSKKRQNLIPVIAEVKPSSPARFISLMNPSKKDQRNISPQDAAEIAGQMEDAGAAAVSVLTEPQFFKGSIENLNSVRQAVKIPVLRKDFIIDKAQIYEAESDLLLLIAGILGEGLDEFVDEVISCGREPLVEVHNIKELERALSTCTKIIGINNRDLTTMKVDLTITEKLAPLISGRIVISESGISTPEEAVRMIAAGADAVLVGTSIMNGNIYEKTYELVHG